jgi:hypothetical protein
MIKCDLCDIENEEGNIHRFQLTKIIICYRCVESYLEEEQGITMDDLTRIFNNLPTNKKKAC